ncbi:MAG TPA: Holliday junction resolvase RuvX [candidate division Zixibacteria bacterium]
MGIDFGERRIGLALSDPLGIIAQPFLTFDTQKDGDIFKKIEELIEEKGIEEIVLGMPKNMDGTIGEKGKVVQEFSQMLSNRVQIPIIFRDERLSSVESLRILRDAGAKLHKYKKSVDKLSAALILQGYLDSSKRKEDEKSES